MDPNNESIMSLIQQAPPPPPPLPLLSTPPSAGGGEEPHHKRSSDGRTDEREEGSAPQLRQNRTVSAPDPSSTFGHSSNMTRKRTHSTSEKSSSIPHPPSYMTQEYPQMFIKNADGQEEVNPDAYLARGFGWVSGTHPTRLPWLQFVEDIQRQNAEEPRGPPAPEFLKKLDQMYPGWEKEGFSIRARSRSNSRSRDNSPEKSPLRMQEEEKDDPSTPTGSPTPLHSPVASPAPAPIEKSDSVSRSPRSESGERFRSRSQSPSEMGSGEVGSGEGSSVKVECAQDNEEAEEEFDLYESRRPYPHSPLSWGPDP